MRTSSIDTWIWFAAVTFAPTWNTPPAVLATVAAPLVVPWGQLALQEAVGQVVLPFFWMVRPQLLPLPLGLAVRTWALG